MSVISRAHLKCVVALACLLAFSSANLQAQNNFVVENTSATSMIIGLGADTSAQNCSPTPDLPNFACANANLYRGAQPTAEGFRQLSMRGVKTVINLRDDDENAQIEEKLVRSAGMNYINIPLGNWLGPKDEKIAEIIKQLNRSENQPVFVHCKRGADRTGMVIAVYRIVRDGWTAKQAQSEADRYSFGWWQFWMKDYINDYYHDYHKDKLRGAVLSGSYLLT